MGFIDYSRIGAPSYSKEINQLGDDLFEAMKLNAEKRKSDEQARHNRALEAYNQDVIKNSQSQNDRLIKVEENKNQREKDKVAAAAIATYRKQMGSGDVPGARATLAAAGINENEIHDSPEPTLGDEPSLGDAPRPMDVYGPEPPPASAGPDALAPPSDKAGPTPTDDYGPVPLESMAPPPPAATEPPPFKPDGSPGTPAATGDGDYSALATKLTPEENQRFEAWRATLPPRLQYDRDYDLRGFWKKNPQFSVDTPGQHMTDEFKLPNHDTFSNESRYYNEATKHMGGSWKEGPNGSSIFVPNDPKFKARIVEDANGERVEETPGKAAADANPDPVSLESQRYYNELRAYQERQAAKGEYDKRKAELPEAQRSYRDATVHELTLPNGQKVRMGEGEARHEAALSGAHDMEDSIMPQLMNQLGHARSLGGIEGAHAEAEASRQIQLFQTHMAAVASNAEKPDVAMKAWREDVRDGTHEARIRDVTRENNATKIEVAKLRPQQQVTKDALSESRLGLSEDEAFRKRADDLNREFNTPKDLVAYRGLAHAVTNASEKNTLLQSGVKFNLARALQGVGPLTDRDLDRLRSAPGVGAKLETWAKQMENGTLGAAEEKTLIDASARMLKQKEEDLKAGVRAYHQLYNSALPWIGRLGKGYLDAEGAARFGDLWFNPGGNVADIPARQTGRSGISRRRSHTTTTTTTTPVAPAASEDPNQGLLDELDKAAGR